MRHHRVTRAARIAREARIGSAARIACAATRAGDRVVRERNGSRLSFGTDQPSRTRGSAARRTARGCHGTARDQRALEHPVGRERVEHLPLVAGQLEIDVELDAVERVRRRGAPAPPRACAASAPPRPRSRGRGSGGPRAGQDVELDHVDPGRERGVETREGIARGDQIGALVSDTSQLLTSAHQYVVRLSSPWPTGSNPAPQRGHGRPRSPYTRAVTARGPSSAERIIGGRSASITRSPLPRTRPRAAPRIHPGLPAPLRLPHVADPSHIALVEQRVAERAGRVVGAKPREKPLGVELVREHVGSERRKALVEPRPALGHQLEQRPVELHDLPIAGPQDEPRPRARAPPAPSSRVHTPGPVMRRCEWSTRSPSHLQEQVLAMRVDAAHLPPGSRSGQRSSACRGCGVRTSSGIRPTSTGRIRFAA